MRLNINSISPRTRQLDHKIPSRKQKILLNQHSRKLYIEIPCTMCILILGTRPGWDIYDLSPPPPLFVPPPPSPTLPFLWSLPFKTSLVIWFRLTLKWPLCFHLGNSITGLCTEHKTLMGVFSPADDNILQPLFRLKAGGLVFIKCKHRWTL